MSKRITQLPVSSTPTTGDIIPVASAGTTVGIAARHYKRLFDHDAGLNIQRGISGNLIISGNASISGGLLVSGSTKLGNQSDHKTVIVGSFEESGNMFVSGGVTINNYLYASGEVLLGTNASSNIHASGDIRLSGPVTSVGPHTIIGSGFIRNSLIVSGSGQFGTAGSIASNHIFYGLTTFNETGVFRDKIIVSGSITGQSLNIDGNIYTRSSLTVGGDTTLGDSSSDTVTNNSLQINLAQARFDSFIDARSNVSVRNNLIVSGNTTLGDNSSVDLVTIVGQMTVQPKFMVWSGMDVTGNSIVSGRLNVQDSGIFYRGITSAGRLTVSGRSWLGSGINDITYINGTGYISGSLTVNSNLGVSGILNVVGGVQGDFVKKGMFDPQVKKGLVNGLYYVTGGGVNKIFFKTISDNFATRATWNTGEFLADDVVYVSGITHINAVDAALHKAYCGFFVIDSLLANGFYLRPTGIPISPPTSSHLVSGGTPYIYVHYRSGWLNGISGVKPELGSPDIDAEGSNDGNRTVHHKIIFNKNFSNANYIVGLSVNQGSGSSSQDSHTVALKVANVSYIDKNLVGEKTVVTNRYDGGFTYDMGELSAAADGVFIPNMPTRLWARFEEL